MLSVSRSSADSIVETSGRKIIFPPFDTLGDEPYSPCHKVDAETLRSPAIILIVPYASRAKFPVCPKHRRPNLDRCRRSIRPRVEMDKPQFHRFDFLLPGRVALIKRLTRSPLIRDRPPCVNTVAPAQQVVGESFKKSCNVRSRNTKSGQGPCLRLVQMASKPGDKPRPAI